VPNHKERYYNQNLKQTWSHAAYKKYINAPWQWRWFPFDDDFTAPTKSFIYSLTKPVTNTSILEIGSAMGQGYAFLKYSGLVDLHDYTGIEISDLGYAKSIERFPKVSWIQADFTKYELTRSYDYAFERHGIHHMPEPVKQIRKTLQHVKVSMSTTFVGCLEDETVSDLDKGYYNNAGKGLAYFDIISVTEVVQVGLEEGFNHIRVAYSGKHEPIPTDPEGHQYLAPEVQAEKTIGRYTLRISRSPGLHKPLVYLVNGGRLGGLGRWVGEPWNVIRLKINFHRLKSKYASKAETSVGEFDSSHGRPLGGTSSGTSKSPRRPCATSPSLSKTM